MFCAPGTRLPGKLGLTNNRMVPTSCATEPNGVRRIRGGPPNQYQMQWRFALPISADLCRTAYFGPVSYDGYLTLAPLLLC